MKRILAASLAFALAAASGSAAAGHVDDGYDRSGGERYDYDDVSSGNGLRYDVARVVSVDPIVEPGPGIARNECRHEPRDDYRGVYGQDRRYRDDRAYRRPGPSGGAVLGAIIGGALGHQTGKGDGRHAATIAGAVIGGAIGHSIARDGETRVQAGAGIRYEDDVHRDDAEPCGEVGSYEQDDRVVGYRVAFDYNGQIYHSTLSHHPGNTVRVRVEVQIEEDNLAGY